MKSSNVFFISESPSCFAGSLFFLFLGGETTAWSSVFSFCTVSLDSILILTPVFFMSLPITMSGLMSGRSPSSRSRSSKNSKNLAVSPVESLCFRCSLYFCSSLLHFCCACKYRMYAVIFFTNKFSFSLQKCFTSL